MISISFAQENISEYLQIINLSSTQVDTTISDSLFYDFDERNSLLKSFQFDLNNDGIMEKFITSRYYCGSGGCDWLIKDHNNNTIGSFFGKTIFVRSEKINDYYEIETFWKYGGYGGSVTKYEFREGKYKEVNSKTLNRKEAIEYFQDTKKSKR